MISKDEFKKTVFVFKLFIVFVVFLVLKLTGYIDWSWWYIALPVSVPPVFNAIGMVNTVLLNAVEKNR